jgi:CheY-like chemotaxis protein
MKQTINKKYPCFILLDDDVFALALAEKIIRQYCRHSEIITFSAPKEAIKYMEAEDFVAKDTDTVFLTDLHMPEIDGFTVLDRMGNTFKAMGDQLHVFVMSSATSPDEIRRALAYSYVIGFISKPFSNDKMEQIMDCIQYPL